MFKYIKYIIVHVWFILWSRKPATLKHVVLIRNLIVFNYTNNPILYCMYYISWLCHIIAFLSYYKHKWIYFIHNQNLSSESPRLDTTAYMYY